MLHQRREARKDRGRSQLRLQPGTSVPALPEHGREYLQQRSSQVASFARRRKRREQVEAHHVGRGLRLARGNLRQDLRYHQKRIRRNWTRGHRRPIRYGSQRHVARRHVPARGLRQPEHVVRLPLRRFLLSAPHDGEPAQRGRLLDSRRIAAASRSLRQPRLGSPRSRCRLGQRAACFERRRVHGPLARRSHAHGHQAHRHRSGAHLARFEGRHLVAGAPRHRLRTGSRHAQRYHQRRSVRSRVR